MAAKQIIITVKKYVDGTLVEETAKVVPPPPDYIKIFLLSVIIPAGTWAILMSGGFR